MEIGIMKLAMKISSILNWFSIRLDYYVEVKQWEIEQRNHSFPKEWFTEEE